MITSFSSGKSSISFGPTSMPSGTLMWPSMRPMFVFFRIERPISEARRPTVAAASTTCWTLWMFEAKQVTTMRPRQRANTSSRRGPTLDSDSDTPGRSAFVESPHRSSRPSRPSSASLDTSAGTPSTGVWSNL
jgi:hypothetical protein